MWGITKAILTLLLVFTAAAKLLNTAELLGGDGLLSSSIVLVFAVAFEAFAAAVIVLSPRHIATRFALVVFAGLAVVSGWAWWTHTDCGCFGAETPKGVPFVVDLVAIGLLVRCGWADRKLVVDGGLRRDVSDAVVGEVVDEQRTPGAGEQKPGDSHPTERLGSYGWRVVLLVAFGMAITGGGLAAWRVDSLTRVDDMPAWFGDNLVGQRLPLLVDQRFESVVPETGEVLLVLLRPDCEHCREFAQAWTNEPRPDWANKNVLGVSIETNRWTFMPGIVSAESVSSGKSFAFAWGIDEEPFVAAPTLIFVDDRVVTCVISGDDVEEVWANKSVDEHCERE